MRKKIAIIIVLLLLFVLIFSGCERPERFEVTEEEYNFLKSLTPEEYQRLFEFDLMLKALSYVEDNYYTDIDYKELDIAVAKALVASLDNYSSLQPFTLGSGASGMIGLSLEVSLYNEYYISYVHPGTPAAEPSVNDEYMMRGDRIYAIDGKRVEGASYAYFSSLSINDTLTLTIKRGDDVVDDFTLTKSTEAVLNEAYYISNLDGFDSRVGYIKLMSFTKDADKHFKNCIDSFNNDGKEFLILDLRSNSGGASDIMSKIANYLVYDEHNSGSVPLIEMERKNGSTQYFNTTSNKYINKPIAVLVNGRTASAAEALLSAMSYYNENTIVIGETTYGKGTALNSGSTILDKDGFGLYTISIIIGKYYIYDDSHPDGKWCIEGIGITPDIEVEDRIFSPVFSEDKDIQAAINNWFS